MQPSISQVFEILDAYVQQFEPGLDRSQLPTVVRTLLPILTGGKTLDQTTSLNLINQVVSRFDAQVSATKQLTDVAKQSALQLAQQITQLRGEDLAKQVLAGFQKKFGVTIAQSELPSFVKMLLPEVPDLFLGQQDVGDLAQKVLTKLGPELASGAMPIVQRVKTIAGLVNTTVKTLQSENLVVDVLKSYGAETMKRLVNHSALPDIIKTIVNATDIKLGSEDGQLSIEEIAFKFKSGTTGTYIRPSAAQIARKVDDAVQGYLAQRSATLQATDVTQSTTTPTQVSADATGLGGLQSIEVRSTLKKKPSAQ